MFIIYKTKHSQNCQISSVTSPLHESRLHWIHDPNPNQSRRVEPKQTVSRNNVVNNTVSRNNVVKNSDSISRNPLDPIPSTSWYNSSLSVPSASSPRNSVYSHSHSVPRITKENTSANKMSASAKCSSPPPKKRRSRKGRVERRARERERERERIETVLLFMMRAGPISVRQFQAFQEFQRE